jgi:hypothetical protein
MKSAAQIVRALEFTNRSRSSEQQVVVQNPTHHLLLVQLALEGFHRVKLAVCRIFSSEKHTSVG